MPSPARRERGADRAKRHVLGITISGLPANRLITIRAKSKAQDQLWWRSAAVFSSGPNGTIDLSSQAPISGAYRGADAMGLFWSMEPDAGPKSGDRAFFTVVDWPAPIITEIEAMDAHDVLGSVTVERRFAKPEVRRTAVAEGGIVGFLYDPGDGQRHKGVTSLWQRRSNLAFHAYGRPRNRQAAAQPPSLSLRSSFLRWGRPLVAYRVRTNTGFAPGHEARPRRNTRGGFPRPG